MHSNLTAPAHRLTAGNSIWRARDFPPWRGWVSWRATRWWGAASRRAYIGQGLDWPVACLLCRERGGWCPSLRGFASAAGVTGQLGRLACLLCREVGGVRPSVDSHRRRGVAGQLGGWPVWRMGRSPACCVAGWVASISRRARDGWRGVTVRSGGRSLVCWVAKWVASISRCIRLRRRGMTVSPGAGLAVAWRGGGVDLSVDSHRAARRDWPARRTGWSLACCVARWVASISRHKRIGQWDGTGQHRGLAGHLKARLPVGFR